MARLLLLIARDLLIAGFLLPAISACAFAEAIDLAHATLVIRQGELPAAEKIAPVILTEEVAKRTGQAWRIIPQWPNDAQAIIALSVRSAPPAWQARIPASTGDHLNKPEGFTICSTPAQNGQPAAVFVTGNDPRGVLFGVGKLLRELQMRRAKGSIGSITLDADFSCNLAPDRAIRGHQVGYRGKANSWDAWTVGQFDQYFRDLAIFGANAVENIPFEGAPSPLMKYSRREMNIKYSELCAKYDLDHWAWVPVLFILPDTEKEAAFLAQQEDFYKSCRRLDAVFVPGGDPGDNTTRNLMPYVERMATLLRKYHPQAKIWISMQRPRRGDVDDFFAYLETRQPAWFGGAVMGPSGPSMETTRRRLPKQYKLRWYPDITHIVRCQYPIPWLDPAWGITLGREPANPRPVDYAAIYRNDYRFTDGFVSYSDGINDDFNKNLWTQLGWEPDRPVREIAADYAHFFFRSDVAETGADAVLALETNLRGSILANGSVEGTLRQWQDLERKLKDGQTNWRFDMLLFRAYYDAYTRHRRIYEADLEKLALEKLGEADRIGVTAALTGAREILGRATTRHTHQEWLDQTWALADRLFEKIGLQTSVPKYQGSNSQRGCVMDFVEYPLNDRWWLEDQFEQITRLSERSAQLKQIDVICNWENPGAGGYYDVIGDVGRSPHMRKLFNGGEAIRNERDFPIPEQRWMGEKRRGLRFAWHTYHDRMPAGITYTDLDPASEYTVKLFSQRSSPLLIDGSPAELIRKGETYDQVTEQEFRVPQEAVQDGRVVLSWKKLDQSRLNWRQHHYVTDIWLMRHAKP